MVRRLAAILRIAEAAGSFASRNGWTNLDATFQRGAVGVQIKARGDASEDLRDANRSAELFEKGISCTHVFSASGSGAACS